MDFEESEEFIKLISLSPDELDQIFSEMSTAEISELLDKVNGVINND